MRYKLQRMDSIAQRLRRFREERGIDSGAELARLAGVPEATYRAYESGRRPLTARAARELARPLGISWQLLLFGREEGEGGLTVATPEEASAVLGQKVSRKPPATRRGLPAASDAELVAMGGDSWALLPVYDARVSAGPGRVMDAAMVSHRIAFREEWLRSMTAAPIEQLAVIAHDADSMEPTLRKGDSVLVDMSQHQPEDGIYAIRGQGGLQVKRLQIEFPTGRMIIHSDNKAYESQRNVKLSEVQVLGRVIWLGRQVGS